MIPKNIYLIAVMVLFATTTIKSQIFVEKNGVVKVEMESILTKESWKLETSHIGFSGSGYFVWTGNEYFNSVNSGILEYRLKINNPGKYRMLWYTKVGKGNQNSEHNDTWLKFEGVKDFYGLRGDNHKVYPHGVCTNNCPNGAGLSGFFKVYGANTDYWDWRGATSDNDTHDIYVEFENPGIYTMKLAARSAYHLIDKFILFNTSISGFNTAASNITPFSETYPIRNIKDTVFILNTPLVYDIDSIPGFVKKIEASADNKSLVPSIVISELTAGKTRIQYNLGENITGNATITYTVTDENNIIYKQYFRITVIESINNKPTFIPLRDTIVFANSQYKYFKLNGISDGNSGKQNLTFTFKTIPNNFATIKPVNYTTGDTVSFEMLLLYEGIVDIIYTVKDNGGILLGGKDIAIDTFRIEVKRDPKTAIVSDQQIEQIEFYNTSDYLSINNSDLKIGIHSVKLFHCNSGICLYEKHSGNNGKFHLYIGNLPSGMYIVQMSTSKGILTKKIIK